MWTSVIFYGTIFSLTGILSSRALRMPLRRNYPHSTLFSFNNSADPFNFGAENLQGDYRIAYVGTIFVDDKPFEVELDTGSSDLWIDSTGIMFNNAENTHIEGEIGYVDGTVAEGDILIAEVVFGDFNISRQAFINAPGSNATHNGDDKGLLGIGPPLESTVSYSLQNSSYSGSSLLDNIFNIYPNEPNIMTMMLIRSGVGLVHGGVFTIGDIDPAFSAITNSPKLPVITKLNQWHTLMDGMIINGQTYSGQNSTNVPTGVDPTSLVILLDSGTSLAALPAYYVDLIYKDIPGAILTTTPGFYQLPCDTKINVSMIFSGQEYPMHPLDLTEVFPSDDGKTVTCYSTLRYADETDKRQDMVLGDSFMRNVYSLFNFGNYTSNKDEVPYMQILSLTDKNKAWTEFDYYNSQRILQSEAVLANNATNQNNTQSAAVAGNVADADDSTTSPGSEAELFHTGTIVRNSYIIIGMLGGIIVVLFGIVVLTLRKQGRVMRGYDAVSNPVAPFEHKTFVVSRAHDSPYDP